MRLGPILTVAGLLVVVILALSSDKQDNDTTTAQIALDYSKPIYTTSTTIVCPLSLLSDMRADHSPEKVADMFNSVWSRSEKAKELGCEEIQPGIAVRASHLADGFAVVRLQGGVGGSLFTMEVELTNKVPKPSNGENEDGAKTPGSNAPPAEATQSLGGSSPTAGTLLVTMPSREPILSGTGRAATDANGFGAVVCPNGDSLAAFSDSVISGAKDGEPISQSAALDAAGCTYLQPGTPMTSDGANQEGSLAIVTAKMPNGAEIHGVTFPNMFVRDQEQSPPREDLQTTNQENQPSTPTSQSPQP